MTTLRVPIPQDLPPALALALFELYQDLSHAVWEQYEVELLQLIMAESDPVPRAPQTFDFNDRDLPF